MNQRQTNNHPWRGRRRVHADFERRVVFGAAGERRLLIVDLNRGGRSVTNDMRWVLERVAYQVVGELTDYEILYRDSQGMWDRVDARTGQISAGPRDGSIEALWKREARQ